MILGRRGGKKKKKEKLNKKWERSRQGHAGHVKGTPVSLASCPGHFVLFQLRAERRPPHTGETARSDLSCPASTSRKITRHQCTISRYIPNVPADLRGAA
ncbi:hypothetical protein EVAR_11349_1 [Eumeta japonica]|uniref:Uncharacterized protein n=1 Tax=Eumeta variegata TaxID=151549 RepID=A0A4C1U0Z9_EUMVA|nr:hypothetical protein EVAR_11349_1 [Eumeta japonica]